MSTVSFILGSFIIHISYYQYLDFQISDTRLVSVIDEVKKYRGVLQLNRNKKICNPQCKKSPIWNTLFAVIEMYKTAGSSYFGMSRLCFYIHFSVFTTFNHCFIFLSIIPHKTSSTRNFLIRHHFENLEIQ